MALHNVTLLPKSMFAASECSAQASCPSARSFSCISNERPFGLQWGRCGRGFSASSLFFIRAVDRNNSSSSNTNKKAAASVPSSNYVVPLDKSSCITRPLAEILRDLNKRVPDNIVKPDANFIPWYHANRMLSFYAPGWCGEIRDVIFSDNGSVTVVYRVKIRGSDGEAHRDSTGTVSVDDQTEDPVAAAEQIAFCRACARFGLGLYLYHEDGTL